MKEKVEEEDTQIGMEERGEKKREEGRREGSGG